MNPRPTTRTVLRDAENVGRAEPFGTLLALELDGLAFIQRLVALLLDGGEMDEDVFAGVALDEAIAFGAVEPLHYTRFLHSPSPVKIGTALLPACSWQIAMSRGAETPGNTRRSPRSSTGAPCSSLGRILRLMQGENVSGHKGFFMQSG